MRIERRSVPPMRLTCSRHLQPWLWRSCSTRAAGRVSVLRRSAVMLSIASLFLCGCDFSQQANPLSQEVTDKSGTSRLALIYIPAGPGPLPKSQSFDFHSLVWRTKVGTNWSDRVVITKADFEASRLRKRWVSDVYSLDPCTGNAVIKVAEVSLPHTNGTTVSEDCRYSWREWNVNTNAEVRVLRICQEPFEPFKRSWIKLWR